MGSFLFTIASFIVALGILITVHEFGHFWVARKLGVKVLRFSIGFGKPLLTFRGRPGSLQPLAHGEAQSEADLGTEYVVAAIPLGGYVKMLDEREGEVPQRYLDQAFNRKPVAVRSAIVAAGPLFNFAFAILAFWIVGVTGDTGSRPWIGSVAPDSIAAEAGFQAEDEFISIGNVPTPTWESVVYAMLTDSTSGQDVTVTVRDTGGMERVRVLPGPRLLGLAEDGQLLGRIGLAPKRPQIDPVIGRVVAGEPAQSAGLLEGDRVLAIDGEPVASWSAMVEYIQARPGTVLQLTIERGGETQQRQVVVGSKTVGERSVGRIGVGPRIPEGLFEPYRVEVRYGPVEAVGVALGKTGDMSLFMLKVLGRMLTGELSVRNLSGPISIAQTAGKTASYGFTQFMKFLALVSISLGVLNLLPVPILDGGHLFYFMLEAIKGSPLSERTQALGQRIGLAILLGLMTLAFYVDLSRLFE